MKPKKLMALDALLDESRALVIRLQMAADDLHQDLGLTPGMRALLRHLAEQGPATVPQIARAREVSRQHVQMVVNRFNQLGLIKFVENPEHRRSRLVRLSKRGRKLVAEMDRRERKVWDSMDLKLKRADLDEAAGVLSRIRMLFLSKAWKRTAEKARARAPSKT